LCFADQNDTFPVRKLRAKLTSYGIFALAFSKLTM